MSKKTAVIIKGNPKYVERNKEAQEFYQEIKKFLEDLGYQVTFDAGLPHTIPPVADLWIGHSRGTDRFRFAPKGVKLVALGSDWAAIPDHYHYIFTKKMKDKIKQALGII